LSPPPPSLLARASSFAPPDTVLPGCFCLKLASHSDRRASL
jgi:hypothetical protein